MVKIRLQRVGAKKKPAYRVVVADSRSPRDGSFIEVIGHYDPRTEPPTIVIKQEKALEWLGRGAQPTPTVASLLSKAGVSNKQVSAFLRKATDRKTLKKAEKKAKKEAKAAPAAEAKPAKAPEAKPAEAPEAKPAEASKTKTAEALETKTAKAPKAKPAKASETKPAKAPDIKPAAASENE
jgi:small subunit ribosomal protein S16